MSFTETGDALREAFHIDPDATLGTDGTYEEYDAGVTIDDVGLCWYQDATTEEISPVSDDLTVLLAQVTTNGKLTWCLNFMYHEYDADFGAALTYLYTHEDGVSPGDWVYDGIINGSDIGMCGEAGPHGCTDPTACNYCEDCLENNQCCIAGGCSDMWALNYDPTAFCDNGSCIYPCTLPGDFDFNGIIGTSDVLILLGEFGCDTDCIADLTDDGFTLTADLLILLGNMGNTCD